MSDKKNNSKSNQGNFLIPLMLLLVSIAVVVATFYENSDQVLLAQVTTQTDSVEEQPKVITSTGNDTITDEQENNSNENLMSATADTEQVISQDNEVNSTPAGSSNEKAIASAAENKIAEPIEVIVTAQATENTTPLTESKAQRNSQLSDTPQQFNPETSAITNARPLVQTPYQNKRFNREYNQKYYNARVAYAQEQARQYHEMMQQRRQSYLKEIQSRRLQHEAAMKAQNVRKNGVTETQKTRYQQSQQERIETNLKIQAIHNRISELHQEIHQIRNNSRSTGKTSSDEQQTYSETNIEKI